MDPITHALLGYSFIYWIKKVKPIPITLVIPFLIGSVLPDIDLLFAWVSYFLPQLFWVAHRTITHSFLGVIPFVLLAAYILNQPKMKNIFLKYSGQEEMNFWSIGSILALYLGTWNHFLADFFVPTGIMVLFPFSLKWYGIKVLTTNNLHTLVAFMYITTIVPLNWNKAKRNQVLMVFMVVFTVLASFRSVACINSIKVFREEYGANQSFSAHEIIFSNNIVYKIESKNDPLNRTITIAIIDGVEKKIISEQILPECRIMVNSSEDLLTGQNLVNITKTHPHYHRFQQKNSPICVIAQQEKNGCWSIRWFAPIREAELNTELAFFNYSSSSEAVVFKMTEDGTILKIIRPLFI
ncbi:MAG: hypothetical protein GF308_12795 [Candidatus Heimdallarchaeota archaeon]|nr:hypothetical protein [Candidatus Heimdallarchaeota archaeon]